MPHTRPMILLAVVLLSTTALTGCIGDEEPSADLEWSSYEAARDADGPVFEPEEPSPLRVKWLMPDTPDQVPQGQSSIFLLVFDSEQDAPVTDANVSMGSWMPAMGHGTTSEESPGHVAYGVYEGVINPTMGGPWQLNLTVTLADGESLGFQIAYTTEGGSMDGGHGNMSDGDAPTTHFSSYQEAKDAPGRVYEPTNASGATRLKLIEPADAGNVTDGATNVTVLLFDEDADEPITDANVTLDARMPAMGHGTSPEEDPRHAAHGVYKGMTTFPMEGKWRLDLTSTLADDTSLDWSIEVDVGNVSETWGSQGPPFEAYNRTFEDDVQSADYSQARAFTVEGANATVEARITLTNATPLLDEINMTITDPDGASLGSVIVNADSTSGSLTIDAAPAAGDYTAQVTGSAVNAHYEIVITVKPPS